MRSGARPVKGSAFAAAFAEDDFEVATPVLGEGDELPLDLGLEVTQHGLVGGMNAEGRGGEDQARREGRDLDAGKIAVALER